MTPIIIGLAYSIFPKNSNNYLSGRDYQTSLSTSINIKGKLFSGISYQCALFTSEISSSIFSGVLKTKIALFKSILKEIK
jgi:hypothetical protein